MVNKLVIIGPAWPLRGGLSAFDEKLATQFTEKGIQTRIDTFSLQYPSILFIGVNIQSSFNEIKTEPHLKKLEIQQQFKLTKDSAAHLFLTSNYPRVILVNNEGIVKNGFNCSKIEPFREFNFLKSTKAN